MTTTSIGRAQETKHSHLIKTPILDRMLAFNQRDLISFHALPVFGGRSLVGSRYETIYHSLYGETYLQQEMSVTGTFFDSPTLPTRLIEESQKITAEAFGSMASFYVTAGTTVSNEIAVQVLGREKERTLIDRMCHQSIHYNVLKNRNRLTYVTSQSSDRHSAREFLDVEEMIRLYREAFECGDPYKLVVLSCSYDGVLYDIRKIIESCLDICDDVSFLIDEAWFAFGYFHPYFKPYTAMHAAGQIREARSQAKFRVIATQSAHKTLSALRQASYLHVFADADTVEAVRTMKFAVHTTSPSYPILCSLELARAQIVEEGEARIEQSLQMAQYLRQQLQQDMRLACYSLNDSPQAGVHTRWTLLDPLRVSINLSQLHTPAAVFKEYAFEQHGVYINRITDTSVLINVHIGVTKTEIDRLLEALRAFAEMVSDELHIDLTDQCAFNELLDVKELSSPDHSQTGSYHVSNDFVLLYPPGVPFAMPGELYNEDELEQLRTRTDVQVISVPHMNFSKEEHLPCPIQLPKAKQ